MRACRPVQILRTTLCGLRYLRSRRKVLIPVLRTEFHNPPHRLQRRNAQRVPGDRRSRTSGQEEVDCLGETHCTFSGAAEPAPRSGRTAPVWKATTGRRSFSPCHLNRQFPERNRAKLPPHAAAFPRSAGGSQWSRAKTDRVVHPHEVHPARRVILGNQLWPATDGSMSAHGSPLTLRSGLRVTRAARALTRTPPPSVGSTSL